MLIDSAISTSIVIEASAIFTRAASAGFPGLTIVPSFLTSEINCFHQNVEHGDLCSREHQPESGKQKDKITQQLICM